MIHLTIQFVVKINNDIKDWITQSTSNINSICNIIATTMYVQEILKLEENMIKIIIQLCYSYKLII